MWCQGGISKDGGFAELIQPLLVNILSQESDGSLIRTCVQSPRQIFLMLFLSFVGREVVAFDSTDGSFNGTSGFAVQSSPFSLLKNVPVAQP